MAYINAYFNDFEQYNDNVGDWDLTYRLLSKNDFSANINRFSSETFSLARLRLNGTIEHKGQAPSNTISFVIPKLNSTSFLFHNKRIATDTLLILPKNHSLDVVSHNDYDIYIVNITEGLAKEIITQFSLGKNWLNSFNNVQQLHLTKAFSVIFHQMADKFLNIEYKDEKKRESSISHLNSFLFTYIDGAYLENKNQSQKSTENKLGKAVSIINNQDELYSIPQLCALVGISERSLLYYFKEKYKVSTSEYIKAIRLSKVKRDLFILKDEKITISTIAKKYHFWHMGQFAKDFKKQFGITPTEYRNEISDLRKK